MKRMSKASIVILIGVLSAQLAFADGSVVPPEIDPTLPPEWLKALLIWMQQVPYVGPVLVEVGKWSGVVAVILTLVSYTVQGILAIPEIAARFSGSHEVADKIKFWGDKIVYWLKFFSIRNANLR